MPAYMDAQMPCLGKMSVTAGKGTAVWLFSGMGAQVRVHVRFVPEGLATVCHRAGMEAVAGRARLLVARLDGLYAFRGTPFSRCLVYGLRRAQGTSPGTGGYRRAPAALLAACRYSLSVLPARAGRR